MFLPLPHRGVRSVAGLGLLLVGLVAFLATESHGAPADDATPPAKPIKLVFVHHSVGENWLADGHGNLGHALAKNRYFVSDTNYGWGPDGIGDRTDIVNWTEWFSGPQSSRHLKALFRENETHSPYARAGADPGGENRIIVFKSCYPNSELEGRPDDPAKRGEGLTVGNAKAIYKELLAAFQKRPDKLFVVITAPPVRERTRAANARAFNNWLVKDWLARYRGTNVAVFDFYNVLTGAANHHRFVDGSIQHVNSAGKNTLHYPSEDDHPSPAGGRKATAEFVPLLNVYVRRWLRDPKSSTPPPPESAPKEGETPKPPTPAEPQDPAPRTPTEKANLLDDFEGGRGTWQVFTGGEGTSAVLSVDKAHARGGKASLRIDYEVVSGGWATCSLVYDVPRDWRTKGGLVFYVRAERTGQSVDVIAYEGKSPDALGHRETRIALGAESVTGWQRVEVRWDQLRQPAWEGDGTTRFDPSRAMGMAFAFPAKESRSTGRLWVDDVGFLPPPQRPGGE